METVENRYSKEQGWINPHRQELDSPQTLLLFFAAPSYFDSPVITDLDKLFPKSIVVGCSTAGEIAHTIIHDESIVYVLIRFHSTTLKLAAEIDYHTRSIEQCGEKIATKLHSYNLRHVLFFSSGFHINFDEFLTGFIKHSSPETSISGGLAGDGEAFSRSWVFSKGFHENALITIGFSGDTLQVKQGCEGGWQKFGLERRITNAKRNILYEIDGEPALRSYKKYLGNLTDKLPSSALFFPIAIRKNNLSDYVVRTILAVNEEEQSITFAGDIPEGWLSCFMRCSNEGLLDGAKRAALQANQPTAATTVTIFISCIGRRMVLGEACFQELESAISVMSSQKQVNIGFYSYGEISEKPNIDSKLHNQTLTITTISEGVDGKLP